MELKPIRISVVSYLNALPFIKGIQLSINKESYLLSQDIPKICAEKLLSDEVDIGLIPVAVIPQLPNSFIFTDYCIGANGKVASVIIVANEPIETLTSIILDRESRTSVQLAQLLARDYWKISPEWLDEKGYDLRKLPSGKGAVIIGNRALEYRSEYRYCYDLADAWKTMTGLPFVFACWVANKKIGNLTETLLNEAFRKGLSMRNELAENYRSDYPWVNVQEYFFENICYDFNEEAKKGLNLFLTLIESIK